MILSTLRWILRRRSAPQPPELSREHNPGLYAAIAEAYGSGEGFMRMRDLAADRDRERLQRDRGEDR